MATYINKATGALLNEKQYRSFCFLMKVLYHVEVLEEDIILEIVRNYVIFPMYNSSRFIVLEIK